MNVIFWRVRSIFSIPPTRVVLPTIRLWGMFYEYGDGDVRLESMSCDLRRFEIRQPLPEGYRYCRRATRGELVEYMTALAFDARRGVNSKPDRRSGCNP